MKIEKITEERFKKAMRNIAIQIKKNDVWVKQIYPIPRGGLIPAVYLSHLLEIPIILENDGYRTTLVVDDICDSGKTFEKILNENTKNKIKYQPFATAFYRRNKAKVKIDFVGEYIENDDWLLFFWENEKKVMEDYVKYTNKVVV